MLRFLRRSSPFSPPVGASSDYRVAYYDSSWCSLAVICCERLVTLQEVWEGTWLPIEKSVCRLATRRKRAGALRRNRCFYWRTRGHGGGMFDGRWALEGQTSECSDEARCFFCWYCCCQSFSWRSSCIDGTRARRCAQSTAVSSGGATTGGGGGRSFSPYSHGVALSMAVMCRRQHLSR